MKTVLQSLQYNSHIKKRSRRAPFLFIRLHDESVFFTNRQYGAVELFVEHFAHCQINGAGATYQTDPARNVYDAFVISRVTHSQQSKQYGQAQEHELQHASAFQGAEEHKQREHTPNARCKRPKWPFAASASPIFGSSRIATSVSQKEP